MNSVKVFCLSIAIFVFLPLALWAAEFKEERSQHFIIRYEEGVEKKFVSSVKREAERYYRKITQHLHLMRDELWMWDNRAKIVVARDKQRYLSLFLCQSWSDACVDYYNKIIYTYPYQTGFSSILAHELAHIIFRERVGFERLPLWLDEGVATYFEYQDSKGLRPLLASIPDLIKEKRYIPFSQIQSIHHLPSQNASGVSVFYVQSFSMVYFLMKRFGEGNFSEFSRYLKEGDDLEVALRRAFRAIDDLESFERLWKRFYLR